MIVLAVPLYIGSGSEDRMNDCISGLSMRKFDASDSSVLNVSARNQKSDYLSMAILDIMKIQTLQSKILSYKTERIKLKIS